MEDKKQPIVVKKIIQGHGHHGGSWKVAFADFATAMMAFFMVLWLVGQTDAKKRGGIAEYFQNPSMVRGHSEAPTGSIGPGGAGMSLISFGTSIEVRKQDPAVIEKVRDGGMAYVSYDKVKEQRRLESLMDELREEIGKSQALKPFKEQLLLEIMPNGLRIQIVDQENRPMFAPGSAQLQWYTEEILHNLAKTINRVSNKITISGHTDAAPLKRRGYSNWELSSDRANAARRALIQGGMKAEKIARVIGLADTILFDRENPRNAINRRISIVVMKREVSELSKREEDNKAIPRALVQRHSGMDKVQDVKPIAKPSTDLDLHRNKQPGKAKGNMTLHEMDMKLQGMKKGKQSSKTKTVKQGSKKTKKRSELDPASRDTEIIIRNRDNAKTFIKLPPIINPGLIQKQGSGQSKQNRQQEKLEFNP